MLAEDAVDGGLQLSKPAFLENRWRLWARERHARGNKRLDGTHVLLELRCQTAWGDTL